MTEKSLAAVIEGFGEDASPTLTVGQMLAAFDSRAFGAMLLGFGLLNTLPPWLPRGVVDKPLKRDDLRGLFRRLGSIVRKMELITRPRLRPLFAPLGERAIGVVCTLLALVLVLPIPLGNLAPGATVAVLALALLQRDGILALLGYLMAVGSGALLFVSAHVVVLGARKLLGVFSGLL